MTDAAQDYIGKIEDLAERVVVRKALVEMRLNSGWLVRDALREFARGIIRDLVRDMIRREIGKLSEEIQK